MKARLDRSPLKRCKGTSFRRNLVGTTLYLEAVRNRLPGASRRLAEARARCGDTRTPVS